MTPAEFDTIVRRQLKIRDAAKRSRLFDTVAYEAADAQFIKVISEATGITVADEIPKTIRRARRAAATNQAAALDGAA